MKKIGGFFRAHVDDFLIGCGLILICYATYQLSVIAAMYLVGFILTGLGVLLGLTQKGKA